MPILAVTPRAPLRYIYYFAAYQRRLLLRICHITYYAEKRVLPCFDCQDALPPLLPRHYWRAMSPMIICHGAFFAAIMLLSAYCCRLPPLIMILYAAAYGAPRAMLPLMPMH